MNEISIEKFLEHEHGVIREGFVAMDKDERWFWYIGRPERDNDAIWSNQHCGDFASLANFAIQPVKDWTKSLYEITPDGWRKADDRN